MTKEELIEFLKENLTIDVDCTQEEEADYGNTLAYIKTEVRVFIGQELIFVTENR